MTKIKNTKKGMAKKTLSVSLAVAMLATSNVPVWAAEFSDGADVAAFTSEAEAPVVETEEVTPASEATVSNNDFSANVTFAGPTNGSIVWDNKITATINSISMADMSSISKLNYVVYYAWKIGGITGSETRLAYVGDFVIDGDTYDKSYTPGPDDVGKNVTLYLAIKDHVGNTVWTYDSDPILVNAKDITSNMDALKINESFTATTEYDGKDHIITKDDINFKELGFNPDAFDIAVSGDTKNVTDAGVTVTITRNDGAYVGTKTLNYKITAKTLDGSTTEKSISANMAATLNTTSFTYTGNVIRVKASDVTLKDKNTDADLSNYLAADEDGYVSLKNINPQDAGEQTFRINLKTPDSGDNRNYIIAPPKSNSSTDKDGYRTIETDKATIKARDLSSVNITVKAQSIPTNGVIDLNNSPAVSFTDKTTGETLNLIDEVDISVVKEVTKAGTYTVEITPEAGNENITGKTTASVKVVAADISGATFTNANTAFDAEEYTGEAVTKTAKQLGSLTLDGKVLDATTEYEIKYENNINAGTAKLIVVGKKSFEGSQAEFTFEIKPASVTDSTITYSKDGVEYIDTTNASDYKDAMGIVVKAKNKNGKEFTLQENIDYVVKYSFADANKVDEGNVKAVITITNKNFSGGEITFEKTAPITAKAIKSENIKLRETTFTYTGKAITPEFDVVVDGKVINPALYTYEFTNNINAGTATLKVKGTNKTAEGSGNNKFSTAEATVTFTISPADASKLDAVLPTKQYKGYSIEVPADEINATLNGEAIDVANNFTLTYGENIEIGEGSVTLTPKNGNFTGTKTFTFKIVGELLKGGSLKYYDKNGIEVDDEDDLFEYDGTAHTFDKVVFDTTSTKYADGKSFTKKLTEGTDYEIVYADNVYGKDHEGIVLVVAKGIYGGGYTGAGVIDGVYTDAAGNKTANVIYAEKFDIEPLVVTRNTVTVSNGVYAGGLPVKPEVSVVVKGKKLVEGTDYDLFIYPGQDTVNATTEKSLFVWIIPKNGYDYDYDYGYDYEEDLLFKWGIDKFDLANADVAVEDGKVVVKCGKVDVESSEYTTTVNAEDGTTTITAVATSKNYTGSKTFSTNGKTDAEKPETPMLVNVNVVGNTATAVLSDECDGATGYDFVIGTSRDCITTKDYVKVNKNVLRTETPFTYVQQGTYYAYCHAWKRVNGVKVFSDWSNAYPFVVTAITPDQPVITSVKASGSTVTVTYTQAANADGYDVVLGAEVKKVAGENRPVNYGELVKKNIKGNTVTATFKNVPAGTYYAGLHAFNRTSEDGKKVFSPWSNAKKVTVK